MELRPLTPGERMTDRFDRASTLNFTTVATVRGPLCEEQLLRALRCLEARHPLLRARLVRDESALSFAPGAAQVPLRFIEGGEELVQGAVADTLDQRSWPDNGPRAELTWIRHEPERSSLLLCLHHVVSDGSSGILAMRDLLSFVSLGDPSTVAALPSPGQDAFFPASHAETRAQFLATAAAGSARARPATRVGTMLEVPLEARRMGFLRVQLTEAESQAVVERAHRERSTVHGILCGALSLAIARELGEDGLQRIAHPVDLRRYLRGLDPEAPAIGEAVGYYVSSVTTEHEVRGAQPLTDLAREISEAVKAAKEAGEPLIAAPLRGPLLVERTAAMDLASFRALAEQKIFGNTFGLTNLGRLELLGISAQLRELEVEELYFVAAQSVMNKLGGSAVSFRGRISLQLSHVEPFVPRPLAERLAAEVQRVLADYARAGT